MHRLRAPRVDVRVRPERLSGPPSMTRRLRGPSMLALVGDLNGPALWRCLQPLTALERAGYRCGWDHAKNRAVAAIVDGYDGIIIPRMSWPTVERGRAREWFALAHRRGQIVVYEMDDDLVSTAMTRHALSAGLHPEKSLAMLEAERHDTLWAMRRCDGVTVSTESLAAAVRAFTERPVVVVPNAIDVPWFRGVLRRAQTRSGGIVIGWAGGQRDEADLAVVAEAWRRVARLVPEVRFVVAGHRSRLLCSAVPPDRLRYRPWVGIERYPSQLAGVTIGCAAVTPAAFNLSKTPIKAWEYALAGAAVVATPAVYGATIEHGATGYLAETADDWTAALTDLVARPAQRAIMARRLERQVVARWSLAENLWRWPAAWSAIAESARARRGRLVAV